MLWFYSILAGILCTVLVNPMFWRNCVFALIYKKRSKAWFKANPDQAEQTWNLPENIRKFDKRSKLGAFGYETLLGGLISETIWFLIGACFIWGIYFSLCTQDIGFVSILSVIWIPAFLKFIFLILTAEHNWEDSYIITIAVIFVISIAINAVTPIYEFCNPKELTVSIIEPEVPTLSVDVSKTLENLKFTDENTDLSEPVYRNGEVIYVLESSDSYTEAAGYVSVEGDKVQFVDYKLKYSTYTFGVNNVGFVARQSLPDKVFFGDFSFQKDEEGTIYYACLYGTHSFLRAGKNIEGLAYVNASTGEVSTCNLEEIPSFMTGISQ